MTNEGLGRIVFRYIQEVTYILCLQKPGPPKEIMFLEISELRARSRKGKKSNLFSNKAANTSFFVRAIQEKNYYLF